jgi:hypothetical protein
MIDLVRAGEKAALYRLIATTIAVLMSSVALAQAEDGWEFQIAPYLWMAGMDGDVGLLPGVPPADVDASFSDILDNLDFAFMLAGEARKGRGGVLGDIVYMDLGASGATPGPLYSTAKLDSRARLATVAGFWSPWRDGAAAVDFLAGARFWAVDTKLSLGAGFLPATSASHDENWIDPFVGARLKGPLGGDKVFGSLGLIAGGFGVGADVMWDAVANIGYRWTDGFSTTLGYRYLSVDYSDGDFVWDVDMHGPTVALIWNI